MKIRDAQNLSNKIVDAIFENNEKQDIKNYEIAKRTNISQMALSYIKRHKRQPTLYILLMIANATGVKLSKIISEFEDEIHEENQ